ncbi:ferredoxin [Nocardia sp. NBC_01499]|uniref:ferredoxin n=1 Tax=Nocardia sp. NBC_01499 TaxID=2903597 RepID=UPI0038632C0E
MRITVDRTRCEGHGMCEALAPNLFRVADYDVVELLADAVADTDRDAGQLAVDSCPMAALHLS